MLIVKLHKRDGKLLVSICDPELLGQRFEEGKLQLDLTGSSRWVSRVINSSDNATAARHITPGRNQKRSTILRSGPMVEESRRNRHLAR